MIRKNIAHVDKIRRGALPLLLSILGCGAWTLSAQAANAPTKTPANEIDEVTVNGIKLVQMRAQIIQTEDRFYELLNQLNTDHDYDMHCQTVAPLGTHLTKRTCTPAFLEKAQSEEAIGILTEDAATVAQEDVIFSRQDDFRKKELAVINSNPKLLQLVHEREALEKKYLAARKERFKGHLILFE